MIKSWAWAWEQGYCARSLFIHHVIVWVCCICVVWVFASVCEFTALTQTRAYLNVSTIVLWMLWHCENRTNSVLYFIENNQQCTTDNNKQLLLYHTQCTWSAVSRTLFIPIALITISIGPPPDTESNWVIWNGKRVVGLPGFFVCDTPTFVNGWVILSLFPVLYCKLWTTGSMRASLWPWLWLWISKLRKRTFLTDIRCPCKSLSMAMTMAMDE